MSVGVGRGGQAWVSDVADGVIANLPGDVVAFVVATLFALFATVLAYRSVPETHVEGGTNKSVKPWEIDRSATTLTIGLVNFTILFGYELPQSAFSYSRWPVPLHC